MDEARFAELIRRHLAFYRALAEGRRAPTTPAQERFVRVARGEAAPMTEHERAFLLWRARAERTAKALDAEVRREARLRLKRAPTPPPPPRRR
ncbi:DUF413 domain-containing protein [Elioraea thermophila]|uniref:DUF413 domain-containing protein n=1 Tax=Elioraea thermophila TaxID=2185104 RepID=UPI000DF14F97|nr:DUF413 domain-containing protein [Elioraea thermophila]